MYDLTRSKPLLARYFDAIGVYDVRDLIVKFAQKRDQDQLVIKISDIYKHIQRDANLQSN